MLANFLADSCHGLDTAAVNCSRAVATPWPILFVAAIIFGASVWVAMH